MQAPGLDSGRFVRIASVVWVSYFVALALLEFFLYHPTGDRAWYPVLNLSVALVVLGTSCSPKIVGRLGRAFLPGVIVLISVVTIACSFLIVPFRANILFAAGEIVVLRATPALFLALLLILWYYPRQYFVLYSAAVTGLYLILLASILRQPSFVTPALIMLVLQFVLFVGEGFFIDNLWRRLRAQQVSLRQANSQLANYTGMLEHLAVSRERNRMARELHDTLAHTLSMMTVQLEAIKAYWDLDPGAAKARLDNVLDASRTGMQETRRALKALRASPLDDLGLGLAIQQLAESAAARANIELQLSLPETLPSIRPEVEQCIYRIAQEALDNVVHHAAAKHVSVQLSAQGSHLGLQICDDGRGFENGAGSPSGHFGLVGMRERAALLGGALEISSRPRGGTLVRLEV